MTVRQLVAEPLIVHRRASGAALEARVREVIALVGLNPEHYRRFPHEFSGGASPRSGIPPGPGGGGKRAILGGPTPARGGAARGAGSNLFFQLHKRPGADHTLYSHD